jgi:hypothetical protein
MTIRTLRAIKYVHVILDEMIQWVSTLAKTFCSTAEETGPLRCASTHNSQSGSTTRYLSSSFLGPLQWNAGTENQKNCPAYVSSFISETFSNGSQSEWLMSLNKHKLHQMSRDALIAPNKQHKTHKKTRMYYLSLRASQCRVSI